MYWIFVRNYIYTWWRHQMETFSALLAFCAGNSLVPGEFHAQRPVTRSFDVFFDLHLNKQLSKQSWGWWFETPSGSLWRQCNVSYHFTDTNMVQLVEILLHRRQGLIYLTVNIVDADNLMTQGARASATVFLTYRQTFNIRCTWLGNIIADHSTWHMASMNWAKTTTTPEKNLLNFVI